MLVEMLS